MSELRLMASSTYFSGLFHQEQDFCRSSKDVLSFVPSPGRKQEMINSGLLPLRSPLVGDPLKPMGWLFSNQCAKPDSSIWKPVLIDVQDAGPNSILFSFGISEQCKRQKKILQYLMSGSNEAEKDALDFSLLSDLTGLQTSAIEMRLRSLVPHDDGFCLYDFGGDESQSSIIHPSDFYASKPPLDSVADLARCSKITFQPDGRVLFTGTGIKMKDLISTFAEFHMSKHSAKWRKQPVLVPHFTRLEASESHMHIHGSSLKMETMETVTFAPLKSPETIKFKPLPKKRSSRKAGRERDLCRRNSFHACESLLSLILDKKRGKAAISSLKKSGPELPQLLNQFSAGIAGTGLAVLFSVGYKVASGRMPIYASTLLNTGFGFGLVWLSWAVNRLRDTVVHISRSSSKLGFNEKELMGKLDRTVNEIFFRAATIMVIAALRFA